MRQFKFLAVAIAAFVGTILGEGLVKRAIALLMCGVLSFHSTACYSYFWNTEGVANAQIPRVRQQNQTNDQPIQVRTRQQVEQIDNSNNQPPTFAPESLTPKSCPISRLNNNGILPVLGLNQWWSTINCPDLPITWTVNVSNAGLYKIGLNGLQRKGWNLSSSKGRKAPIITVIDYGKHSVLRDGIELKKSNIDGIEVEADLGILGNGFYQIKFSSFSVPNTPLVQKIGFNLIEEKLTMEGILVKKRELIPSIELNALFIADNNENTQTNYDIKVDKPPVKSFSKQDLINYFSPVILLNKEEIYQPLDVKSTTWLSPKYIGGGLGDSHQFVDISKNPLNSSPSKAYASILTNSNKSELAINYYFHYQWSNWRDYGGFNNHAGDWEGVTVFLKKGNNSEGNNFWYPCRVAYSQHITISSVVSGGKVKEWKDLLDQKNIFLDNGRQQPKVWVGLGGHASYSEKGSKIIPNVCTSKRSIISALWRKKFPTIAITAIVLDSLCIENHQGDGKSIKDFNVEYLPQVGSANAPEWLRFPGTWGDPKKACSTAIAGNVGCPSAPRGPAFLDSEQVLLGSSSIGGQRWLDPWTWANQLKGADKIINCPPPDEDSPPQAVATSEQQKQRNGKQVKGTSYGDPHLITFDGHRYSFQTVGEFILAKSTDGVFEVQTRQSPVNRSLSLNSAVAMRVGNDQVAFYSKDFPDSDTSTPLRVNGKPTLVQDKSLSLPGGGSIQKQNDGNYVVQWATAEKVAVTIYSRGQFKYMDVFPFVFESQANQMVGLLGNVNGKEDDDLRFRSGDILPSKSTYGNLSQLIQRVSPIRLPLGQLEKMYFDQLNKDFGNSWRVTPKESLFDYKEGQSTKSFTDKAFPDAYLTLDMLSPDQLQSARSQCVNAGVQANLLEGCVFDVGFTGYSEFAARTAQVSNILDIVESVIPGFKNPIPEIIRRLPKIPGLPF